MTIKVWDYLSEYAEERDDVLAAVDRVFSSGTLILGPSCANFEREFAEYCGVDFGVGVDNATNGIFLALRSLGIGQGDEVVTVANTAVPTVSAIVQSGATPRFVDIDPATALMRVDLLPSVFTERTRCVIPVHLYGQCVDMTELLAVTKQAGISVIEDCSQAHGASHREARAGSMGDLGVFSFYPTKPLGAYGDGGMVITNRPKLAERLRRLRFYGMESSYYCEGEGYNSRLDEVQAEILRVKLVKLDSYISRRRKLASLYDELLEGGQVRPISVTKPEEHCYYVYAVRHENRDEIIVKLRENGIIVNVSYPWPIHTMRGFSSLGYKDGDLPSTEIHAKTVFSLPMYPQLERDSVLRVCDVLAQVS
jgi:aminotransferase EvaB